MSFADDMLRAAQWFHAHRPDAQELPVRFASEEEAVRRLVTSLLFEANQAMSTEIELPSRPMLNPVDLRSDAPGIIEGSGEGGGMLITRAVPVGEGDGEVSYYTRQPVQGIDESKLAKPPSKKKVEAALAKAREQERRAFEKEQAREVKRIEARERQAEKRRLAREEKKKQRQANPQQGPTSDPAAPPEEEWAEADGEEEATAREPESEPEPEPDPRAAAEAEERKRLRAEQRQKKELERCLEAVEAEPPVADSVKKRRRLAPKSGDGQGQELEVYESPVPHDRHLTALARCGLSEAMRRTLVDGEATGAVKMIEGPPGTGKTTRLLRDLREFVARHPERRCLVCSPTNLGAADLFRRAMELGLVGHLSLAKEHIPAGVPKAQLVDLRAAKLVFCTISGRNAPRLWDHGFGACFVDEAALCQEALVWGLLRPEVDFLYMVGDTRQLTAVVSSPGRELCHHRSMMERLQLLGVRAEQLLEQRRMHPEILRWPNEAFYDGQLRTADDRPSAPLSERHPPYQLRQVDGAERRVGTSFANDAEAAEAVRVARELQAAGERVQILVPYQAQLQCVLALGGNVPVASVDSFQGKECDAVVLCTVRTDGEGFWADSRRLAVALTRAKHALRVLGNFKAFAPQSWLGRMHADAVARGAVVAD